MTLIVLVEDGYRKDSVKRERTKGPVLPAVKDVVRVDPFSLPFESSGGYTMIFTASLHSKPDLVLIFGINELEMLLVNLKEIGLRGQFTYNSDEAFKIRSEFHCLAWHDNEVQVELVVC